ncbi:restriction endonuclease subunit S [Microbulbifer echini]|uniref:Restriction endonuclease subunit S n=1 Tax=Microbulbifer echini TaxID=1529067 RepID=A0ABV4NJV3_9GAMM
MASEWGKIPLGDLVALQRGHDLPSQDRRKGEIPIMGSSGLTGYHDEAKCKGPGIVIGRSGNSMGVVSYSDSDFWPLNTALYVTDFKGNDERYIYYLLSQIDFDQFNSGSAQKSLNRNAVYPFLVWATKNKDEQKKIGVALERYENKIQLNRQTNQTLEQMAQALFKSWFVDFDPVIDNALAAGNPIPDALQARAERRQQQLAKPDHKPLPEAIRQHFPCEFEQTEALGWVPKGWESGTLASIANALSGFAFKSKDFSEEGEAVIKIKNIKADRTVDIADVARVPLAISKAADRFLLRDGDIVLAMTGATVGKFGVIVSEGTESYFLNQRVCKLSPKESNRNVFLYSALNKQGVEESILEAAQGSAQPNISAKSILSTLMVIPPSELIDQFVSLMEPSFGRRIGLVKENYKLCKMRDTLLPKLISGELRIPDVEKEVSDAVA